MGLVEFHVDRIDVTTVPKFVLFGGSDRDETGSAASSEAEGAGPNVAISPEIPISPAKVVAVSLAATLLAVAVVRLKELVDSRGNLHC